MKQLLIKQIQFEKWANLEILAAMKMAKPLDDRALLLLSHILSAAKIWLNRIQGEVSTVAMFQERSLLECETLIAENTQNWLDYLDTIDENDLHHIFEFIFPIDGSKRKISVIDGATHLLHHSSYHRGQIVLKLKGSVDILPFPQFVVFSSKLVD
jgi:uncharacterized damage-inducible protein DinB